MNKDHDLELNAYLDGELSEMQRIEIDTLLSQNDELRERLDELRLVKRLVMLSYDSMSENPERHSSNIRRWLIRGLAASFLVLTGYALGTLSLEGGNARHVLLDDQGRAMQPSAADNNETRIVFHLTNPDQVVAGELLDEVEDLLFQFRNQGELLRIEIVSHGEGLGLLRERLSKHQDRIMALASNYENLAFVACQNTINRLRVEKRSRSDSVARSGSN